MKNIVKLLCISPLFAISACSDFLDVKPTNFVSDELIWKDKKLIDQFSANIYGSLISGFTRQTQGYGQDWCTGFGGNFDAGTDDFDGKFDAAVNQFNTNSITAQNCPFTQEIWSRSYNTIRNCNTMIENLPNVASNVLDDNAKAKYEAEFRFLRAYCYFELAKTFERVPLILKAQSLSDDLLSPPSPFEDIIAYIVDDCDKYAANLPETLPSSMTGHATKGAFLALKAKALLYFASPLNNTSNDNDRWSDAALAAKDVMDLGVYELYSISDEPYYNVFFDKSEANKEMIFERRYSFPSISHNIHMMWSTDTGNGGSWNGLYATQNLVDAYETTDGKSITDPSSIYDPQNPYINRDARFKQTLIHDGVMWEGNEMSIWVNSVDGSKGNCVPDPYKARCGYGLRKFIVDHNGPADDLYNKNFAQDNNWPIFRYAEVLLNYAEASNESMSSPSVDVYKAVNLVRSRAGQPDLPEGLSKEEMRDRIHRERRVELCLEEHRFWDLRRWMKADILREPIKGMTIATDGVTKTYNIVEIEKRDFSESLYFLPIPQSECEKNPSLK